MKTIDWTSMVVVVVALGVMTALAILKGGEATTACVAAAAMLITALRGKLLGEKPSA